MQWKGGELQAEMGSSEGECVTPFSSCPAKGMAPCEAFLSNGVAVFRSAVALARVLVLGLFLFR
jgi:hypothetical protein